MSENNKEKLTNNNGGDLFENFKRENDDIDNLLADAFSFMDEGFEEEPAETETPQEETFSTEEVKKSKKAERAEMKMSRYEGMTEEEMKTEKMKKTLYSVLIAILSICIVLVVGVIFKVSDMFGGIYDPGEANPTVEGETLAEEEDFETMFGVTDAASLNDALKKWANNGGEKMSSKNVINILLLGQDGDGGEKSNGRADSIIIASVNKSTKTITLASIMRDSYIFMNVDGRDRYEKINASCYYGGPKGVIEVVEKNYKIDIDYYASVYFGSFKKVVDALGGVTVPIEPGLAAYINRTTRQHVESGDAVLLNGEEALVYSRIRYYYSDSDVSRTANQRRVINGIMQKAKGASVKDLYNVVEAVLPYMKTNMRQTKILSYGKQALTEGWIGYEMQQDTFPTLETRATASIGGVGSCWVVDYPLAAQQLQKLLYGKTNIALDPNRVNVLNNYLTQKPSYTGPSYTGGTQSGTIGYTGEYTENWTGETTTLNPWETTTASETTTSWWQGIIGGETTTAGSEVTEAPLTETPTQAPTEAPTQAPTDAPERPGIHIPGF
ncbi:MAG: LCP family protein [Clostridia bacterium]|nr:LCP family protein [Clostridia bacterium]